MDTTPFEKIPERTGGVGTVGLEHHERPLHADTAPHAVDIRHGEPIADYHSDSTYRSCSTVKTFLDSPLLYHARHVTKTLPPMTSAALSHGTLLHAWLELGDDFLDTLVVPPESRLTSTGLIGKDAEKWAAEQGRAGQMIAPKEMAQLRAEIAALRSNPAVMETLEPVTAKEVSYRWVTADGHRLRCRADLVAPAYWADLKTTSETDILAGFYNSVLKFHYHLQDAWYRRGMEACGMEPAPLRFIVVSTSPTHDCQVVTLPDVVAAEGRRVMDHALAELRLREDLDWWTPDQHGEVVELPFPAHVLRRFV